MHECNRLRQQIPTSTTTAKSIVPDQFWLNLKKLIKIIIDMQLCMTEFLCATPGLTLVHEPSGNKRS